MKFYPSDWASDEKLRMCSLAARGLWIEMIALMHRSDQYGHLLVGTIAPTDAQLAVLVGASPDQIPGLIGELESVGVFSRTRKGVIYSRRMSRDQRKSDDARTAGSKGGNPKLKKGYQAEGFIYLMGQRNDGAYKIGASVNPYNRLKKVRAQYRGQDIQVVEQWAVPDMGAIEADLHGFLTRTLGAKTQGEWFFLSPTNISQLREKVETLKGDTNPQKPEARNQREKEEANASSKKAPAKTCIPDDWQPQSFGDDSEAGQIISQWDERKLRREAEAFSQHHKAKGSKMADWHQAWGTWVNNTVKFERNGNGRQSGNSGAGEFQELARLAAGAGRPRQDQDLLDYGLLGNAEGFG
ncbi:MAG: GIY-YIG nuclease family protein [Blastomonas fulva]|uniref:GIY-YIG nuclease family protein n=1 Tax=Blastomonas fulva TaxID=1550728 RepID=UPI004033F0F2